MDDKDFSLMRKFTGAEGELPCDALGELLSPSEMRLVSSAGFADFVYSAPLAWLDGKPVYPDSLICRKGEQWGTENIDRADGWVGWKDPACLAFFSWPAEAKKEDLGSGDKYVKKDWPRAGPQAGCPCAFCTKFREEQAARVKSPKTYNVELHVNGVLVEQANVPPRYHGRPSHSVSNTFEFGFDLGDVVPLECEVDLLFGNVVKDSLRVYFDGEPFNLSGILLDHEGELTPLSEIMYAFAKQEIREARKGNPTGIKFELF
jgi:hypothetical protein